MESVAEGVPVPALDGPPSGFHAKLFTRLAHAVLFATVPERRVLDVNDEFCRMFRVTREVATRGTTDFMYESHADFERMGAAIEPAVRAGRPATIEWRLRRHDGETFPAEVTIIELRAVTGERTGVVKVIRDLTALKQQERREARRREREAFLAEASALLLGTSLDPEETLRLVADLSTRVLGDYAHVELLEPSGGLRRVVIAQSDPSKAGLVSRYAERHPPREGLRDLLRDLGPSGHLVRNDLDPEALAGHADRPGEAALLGKLGARHHLYLPLAGRRGILGGLGFTRAQGDPYDDEDVHLAKALAERVALAYENALLYRDLERTTAALSDFVETSAIGLHRVGPDGTILWANAADHEPLGYAREEYVGHNIREFHADARVIEDILDRLKRDERLHDHPARLRAKDGSVREVLIDSSVYWEEGRFVHTRCFTRDVTAQRRAEQGLRASEEKLRRILETAPVQVLTIDEAGTILTVNRSFRGADPEKVVGLNAFDTVVEEDRARVRDIVLACMRTGQIAEYETRGILGADETRWFSVRVGPLDLDGKPGAVLVSTDIEERRRIQDEITRVRAQLIQGEKLAALGSLVSGVAHELRTPLTYLSNNAFILQMRLENAARRGASAAEALDEVRPFIAEMTAGVDRINLLVEDLRKCTKARQGAALVEEPLHTLLTEAVELFTATSRASHVIQTSLSPTAAVRASRGALQQLVLNLLLNAAEASPPGSAIRVSTRQEGDAAVLEVMDHGSGIPESVQARMYDPLFTTKPDGTGLGLSIVKRIVADHRATIECETKLGQGTTFRVRFPPA